MSNKTDETKTEVKVDKAPGWLWKILIVVAICLFVAAGIAKFISGTGKQPPEKISKPPSKKSRLSVSHVNPVPKITPKITESTPAKKPISAKESVYATVKTVVVPPGKIVDTGVFTTRPGELITFCQAQPRPFYIHLKNWDMKVVLRDESDTLDFAPAYAGEVSLKGGSETTIVTLKKRK